MSSEREYQRFMKLHFGAFLPPQRRRERKINEKLATLEKVLALEVKGEQWAYPGIFERDLLAKARQELGEKPESLVHAIDGVGIPVNSGKSVEVGGVKVKSAKHAFELVGEERLLHAVKLKFRDIPREVADAVKRSFVQAFASSRLFDLKELRSTRQLTPLERSLRSEVQGKPQAPPGKFEQAYRNHVYRTLGVNPENVPHALHLLGGYSLKEAKDVFKVIGGERLRVVTRNNPRFKGKQFKHVRNASFGRKFVSSFTASRLKEFMRLRYNEKAKLLGEV